MSNPRYPAGSYEAITFGVEPAAFPLGVSLDALLEAADGFQPLMAPVTEQILESHFNDQVVAHFTNRWWLVYHTHDSRRSTPGFPDLVFVPNPVMRRDHLVVVAELKSNRSGSGTSQPQRLWLEAYRRLPNHLVFEWRPTDWPQIDLVANLPLLTGNVEEVLDPKALPEHLREHAMAVLNQNIGRRYTGRRPRR